MPDLFLIHNRYWELENVIVNFRAYSSSSKFRSKFVKQSFNGLN